jgi:hypothetical protein
MATEWRANRHFFGTVAVLVALAAAALALAFAAAPASARQRPLQRAEKLARNAVRQHRSYRVIAGTRTPLTTRSCWRAGGGVARCSLYVVASSPCALDGETGKVCAQALWQRRWLVEVARPQAGHGAQARILRIASGPATAAG